MPAQSVYHTLLSGEYVRSPGVTTLFATNVLGHVVLLEGLLAEDRLGEVAVCAGSEAARGIPKLRMKRPTFVSTSANELATVIDGSYFAGRKADPNLTGLRPSPPSHVHCG